MPETPTQVLHRITSYEPGREWNEPFLDERVVTDFEPNDIARLPWFYKRYEEPLGRTPLPRRWATPEISVLDALAGRSAEDSTPDLAQLSRLLHLSAGLVRQVKRSYGVHPFRAAGSAGARFPVEVYLAIPEGCEVPPGVHWYDPSAHELALIGPSPQGDSPTVVVTGIPWRTGWRYRERGYRHIYWDAGTMLSQLLATARSGGLVARLFTRFSDVAVDRLVGADGVHEFSVAIVALGSGEPALVPTGDSARGAVDRDPVEFPLVTSAQRAGRGEALGPAWPEGAVGCGGAGEPLDEVILRRGSQRLMDPGASVSLDVLEVGMSVALRGIEVPHYVAINAVEGVSPGVYRWPDLDRPARRGDTRLELYRVCLDQGLPRDAAFVAIGATEISELDDPGYREAQLAAGLVGGRLHLLAYALGASASGMTFIDSEVAGLLGAPLDGLLFTCVGVPEYRSLPGGPPGAPRDIKMVTPRF